MSTRRPPEDPWRSATRELHVNFAHDMVKIDRALPIAGEPYSGRCHLEPVAQLDRTRLSDEEIAEVVGILARAASAEWGPRA